MEKQGTILVVDDNKAILTAVKLLLRTCFENVITISTPNLIKQTLQESVVDVVLLDIIMPKLDGIGVLERLKEEDMEKYCRLAEKQRERLRGGRYWRQLDFIVSLAFLAVMFYLDILKYMVARDYWEGLSVVAVVMVAEIFKGIYFNLSFWYKLTDNTKWGAYLSIIGCIVIISLNIIFVPKYGYMACAWAGFFGYLTIMLLSYFIGQKKYPIDYDLGGITMYALLAVILLEIRRAAHTGTLWIDFLTGTLLIAVFIVYIVKKDFPLKDIPIINRLIKK